MFKPHAARHDPIISRFARGLREVDDDPFDWLEAPGARSRLVAPDTPLTPLQRLLAGVLRLVVSVGGMAVLAALLECTR
jgi:hypothetical protein